MSWLVDGAPWLVAMSALLLASGFFSVSETAVFYLSRRDRRAFESGNPAQRTLADLLRQPDQLLASIVFGNLVVNVAYFALSSMLSLRWQQRDEWAAATWLAIGSLLAIILLAEMLPKTLGVTYTRFLAAAVALPLAAVFRALRPVLPILNAVNQASRRVIWPSFRPEPYLKVNDLERAVSLSTGDSALLRHEENVLQSLLLLSELRVEELMRPRVQTVALRPPISLADLEGRLPRSGYVLVTEPDSDEVAAATPLKYLAEVPERRLEHYAEKVVYVPWCASAASALDEMRRLDRRVVVVVNEYGETVGMLTYDDILDTIFAEDASRSARLLNRAPIRQIGDSVWQVTGMTSLSRLARFFGGPLPPAKSVTAGGVVQELLQRVPEPGDVCRWGEFEWKVVSLPDHGHVLLELRRRSEAESEDRG